MMRTLKQPTHVLALTCGALLLLAAVCLVNRPDAWAEQNQPRQQAQGPGNDQEQPTKTAQNERQEPQFAEEFWGWLESSNYRQWAPYPGQGADFYEGQAPHGAFLKTYVNRIAAAKANDLPPGSIIVKENYGEDKQELLAITVMYRSRNSFDPDNNNWYWVKYSSDGSVATTDGNRIAGRVQACIQCHAEAQGDDYVFSNDSGPKNE